MGDTPLYLGTKETARKAKQLQLWKDSLQANIRCRIAIESEIRQGFDGKSLDCTCAAHVIDKFGVDRVRYVLSATLQDKEFDKRFSRENVRWGFQTKVTPCSRYYEFAVQSQPTMLDSFVDQFRAECLLRQMDHGYLRV